jgi:hypothetical protein
MEAAEAAEAEGCIGGGSMYRKHRKSMEVDGDDRAAVNTSVRGGQNDHNLSELVRTEWYSSGVTSVACRT